MSDNTVRQLIKTNLVYNGNKQSIILIEKVKDTVTGDTKKLAHFYEDPDFHFFMSNPEHAQELPVKSMPTDQVTRIDCKYSKLYPTLAKLTNKQKYYSQCIDGNNRRGLSKLHQHNDLHMSDTNLEDFVLREYYEQNKATIQPLAISKGFADIEVDVSEYEEGFPRPEVAPCAINFTSLVDQDSRTLWIYVLANTNNPSQVEFFQKNYSEDSPFHWTEDNNEWIRGALQQWFVAEKKPEQNLLHFQVLWFENELDLIKAFYKQVHACKFDVMGGWNFHFDLKTIETRLRDHLGVDPTTVMCPKKFPVKTVNIREDNFSVDMADRAHTLDVTGWHHNADLQYYYASIRKGRGTKESMKLGDILLEEIGETKLELEGDHRTAPFINFENYLIYSGLDSYRLFQMEMQNKDIDMMFNASLFTHTRLEKVMRKTISLRNLASRFFWENGNALSNNHNKFLDEESEKFKGAFVANSLLIANVGIPLNGQNSINIFEDVIDEDFASLYPRIILAFNIDSNTLIGKIVCDENPFIHEYFGEIVSTGDNVLIGHKVLGLPSFSEILDNIEELVGQE